MQLPKKMINESNSSSLSHHDCLLIAFLKYLSDVQEHTKDIIKHGMLTFFLFLKILL